MTHPQHILPLIATGFLSAVNLSVAAEPAAAAAVKSVTYAADMKPIFDGSCAKCHNSEKARAGLKFDSLEGVLQGSGKRKLVDPGKSTDSRLVKIVESIAAAANDKEGKTRALHKKGPKPFTAEQITLLKAWIDQGAK